MPFCRLSALAFTILLATVPAFAAENSKTGFLQKTFKNADGHESPYVVFVPHDYDGTKAYPVILFLHGSGETKGGSKQPVDVGIGPAIKKREKSFPFIVVIPQSEKRTWQAASDDGKRALAVLDATTKELKTDPKRIYLTGLSMGGFGTWSLASAQPDRWAAIAPVCGRGDPASAEKIKTLPCWAFHGDKDSAVSVAGSRDMIAALKKAGSGAKYTEYPGVGHNCWDIAYGTDELYNWLLEHKKN